MHPIPEPFLFNPLKHHAGYISDFIKKIVAGPQMKADILQAELNIIGKSQTDLYTGKTGISKITDEIWKFLEHNRIIKESDYLSWLGQDKPAYRTLTIKDGSQWVLLPGKNSGRWIHIHPARYSPFTIRVRSETLKTAIALIYHCYKHGTGLYNLNVINHVRMSLLNLSPMKDISPHKGTGKIIRILSKAEPDPGSC